jgi:hypothetical protein
LYGSLANIFSPIIPCLPVFRGWWNNFDPNFPKRFLDIIKNIVKNKTSFWRFLEIFPGAVAWIFLISPIVFSSIAPSAVAVYILFFDFYWLLRALYMAWYLSLSYKRMKKALRTDFGEKLAKLTREETFNLNPKDVYQTIIFATFGEEENTLGPSISSVIEAEWNPKKKLVVLAGEERDKERLYRVGEELKRKYSDKLFDFLIMEHPDGIAGEVRGKGAGAAWAGRRFSEYVSLKGLNEDEILITIADADTRFHRQYFNNIAYEFAKNPNRHRRSFQPIPLYSNNIWYAPTISRLTAWGSSFWQMIEASRPWRLVNFSTHSYSLRMLREMDYWAVNVVNEDSCQFWRAYFAFNGDHEAIPIYLPVHLDAVLADDIFTTMKNQYLQKRRWAYGVEHFPYIVTESIKHKEIPFADKFIKIWRLLEGTITWSTASFYLMFVGWLPVIFSEAYRNTVLAYNFPSFARAILSLAWIGLIVSIYVSLSFLPPRPRNIKKMRYLEMAADWIVTPISAIFFGSIPALESQTRLALGQYLTFWVTPKKTIKDEK